MESKKEWGLWDNWDTAETGGIGCCSLSFALLLQQYAAMGTSCFAVSPGMVPAELSPPPPQPYVVKQTRRLLKSMSVSPGKGWKNQCSSGLSCNIWGTAGRCSGGSVISVLQGARLRGRCPTSAGKTSCPHSAISR